MSGRWWRAYGRARHDPKILKLSDKHFRWWFNLVCVASDNDGLLPPHADLAVEFRVAPKVMTEALDALVAAGLFDHDDRGIRPHNWNGLQYKHDVSTERVKRFRQRHETVSETPSESETEAETEQTLAKARERAPMPSTPKGSTNGKSGTRLPEGWRPDAAGRAYAAERGIDPDTTADAFADWWLAANGPTALKRDWNAAFRTWCRRDAARPVGRSATSPVRAPRGNDAFYEQLAVIASRDGNDGPVRS